MFFFFLTSTFLISVAGLVKSRLSLCCLFLQPLLVLSEDSESWVEVGLEALALGLFSQWSFAAP